MSIKIDDQVISTELISRIIEHEGMEESAYQDNQGWWTIGCGRLIDKRKGGKLSECEIDLLLQNDLIECENELKNYSWYLIQDDVRKGVLIELIFSMGLPNFLEFIHLIEALKDKNYHAACYQLQSSKWANQDVGEERVVDVLYRLENGTYK